jgi:hypothetical protein
MSRRDPGEARHRLHAHVAPSCAIFSVRSSVVSLVYPQGCWIVVVLTACVGCHGPASLQAMLMVPLGWSLNCGRLGADAFRSRPLGIRAAVGSGVRAKARPGSFAGRDAGCMHSMGRAAVLSSNVDHRRKAAKPQGGQKRLHLHLWPTLPLLLSSWDVFRPTLPQFLSCWDVPRCRLRQAGTGGDAALGLPQDEPLITGTGD